MEPSQGRSGLIGFFHFLQLWRKDNKWICSLVKASRCHKYREILAVAPYWLHNAGLAVFFCCSCCCSCFKQTKQSKVGDKGLRTATSPFLLRFSSSWKQRTVKYFRNTFHPTPTVDWFWKRPWKWILCVPPAEPKKTARIRGNSEPGRGEEAHVRPGTCLVQGHWAISEVFLWPTSLASRALDYDSTGCLEVKTKKKKKKKNPQPRILLKASLLIFINFREELVNLVESTIRQGLLKTPWRLTEAQGCQLDWFCVWWPQWPNSGSFFPSLPLPWCPRLEEKPFLRKALRWERL